jgi:pre-mRNA-processing factor 17
MSKPITSTKGAVPTGYADEIALSENTFRSAHRAVQAASGPTKKRKREETGDASVVYGANAYKGPWAKFKEETPSEEDSEDEDGSDDDAENEGGEPADDEPPLKLATDYEANDIGETTQFHGSQLHDYQGRTYMHVPLDLDIDLRGDKSGIKSFWPKNLLHTWKEQQGMILPTIWIGTPSC